MKPAPFEYERPESVAEALDLLAQYGDEAKLLAGGQSLVPTMSFRLAQPAVLIDLNAIPELAGISEEGRDGGGGQLRIGAMTRQRAVERSASVTRRASLLAEALPWIAHPQIRNRGTLGGSLAHADPAAELPAVALASEAEFVLRRRSSGDRPSERLVPAGEFFLGLFETALEPDELLVEIRFPCDGPRTGTAFVEFARRHGDYALVGVATRIRLDETGRCEDARIALLSAADRPILASRASSLLTGSAAASGDALTELLDEAAATLSRDDVDPTGDVHASPEFRRHLARHLSRRALGLAFERARTRLRS